MTNALLQQTVILESNFKFSKHFNWSNKWLHFWTIVLQLFFFITSFRVKEFSNFKPIDFEIPLKLQQEFDFSIIPSYKMKFGFFSIKIPFKNFYFLNSFFLFFRQLSCFDYLLNLCYSHSMKNINNLLVEKRNIKSFKKRDSCFPFNSYILVWDLIYFKALNKMLAKRVISYKRSKSLAIQ